MLRQIVPQFWSCDSKQIKGQTGIKRLSVAHPRAASLLLSTGAVGFILQKYSHQTTGDLCDTAVPLPPPHFICSPVREPPQLPNHLIRGRQRRFD